MFGLAHDGHCVYSCGEDKKIAKIDCRITSKPVTETVLEDYAQVRENCQGEKLRVSPLNTGR